jgi:DNA polymerase III delta prime subunit
MPNKLWTEVYRPTTIKDYVFQNEQQKEQIMKFIAEKSIPHLLFKGHRGTGKTTLAVVLKNELGVEDGDFKRINASDDNSIDVMRGSIKSFAQTMPLGDFKIVFLDEFDFCSQSAQAALRGMMEEFSDTVRFILTCNKPHKVIPEIKSRCQEFTFKEFDKKEMAVHAFKILKKEGVRVTDASLIKQYVDDCYPDMRKLLSSMEANVINGELKDPIDVGDSAKILVDIVEQLSKGKWMEVREQVIQNIDDNDWDSIYTFLYENLDQVQGFDDITNWKKGILVIADSLSRSAQVPNPEIHFTACMIRLSDILKKE